MRSHLLEKRIESQGILTNEQVRLDSLLTHFNEEASNFQNIAAMTFGSAAFRLFRSGSLACLGTRSAHHGLNALSYTGALGLEVSVYRASHSLLAHSSEGIFHRVGWLQNFADFFALKLSGGLTRSSSPVLSQFFQASTLVATRQLNAALGFSEKPSSSLFEQWFEAEVMNLSMMLGQRMFGLVTGERFHRYERSLELGIQASLSSSQSRVFSLLALSPKQNLPVFSSEGNVNSRLLPVRQAEDIPSQYRDTPIGRLLQYHNLGQSHPDYPKAELLIGMCMDHRHALRLPPNFAYVLRAGGANLRYSEFKVSYAIAVAEIKSMALIGHTQCGMAGLHARKEIFIEGMVKNAGWTREMAEEHFRVNEKLFEISDPVDFTLSEVHRLRQRYPRVEVAPLLYRVEDHQLYLLSE